MNLEEWHVHFVVGLYCYLFGDEGDDLLWQQLLQRRVVVTDVATVVPTPFPSLPTCWYVVVLLFERQTWRDQEGLPLKLMS